ncbi:pentatricopeptide repeat-containing protein At4g19220, mitochondrial [Nicotiana tabacum]|uniref:Pentatricopeptide repeat-containing protein At4g19220, mitochondrial n=1 Tax=Nicotiana tabacum TaxID=4097 RepID=A0A1S4D435_TOBAC|nr:PREDICTED: pentatricopeptide repeat-containing protein At4g19220, mitochondrial-like [Nicotiana tabacum]
MKKLSCNGYKASFFWRSLPNKFPQHVPPPLHFLFRNLSQKPIFTHTLLHIKCIFITRGNSQVRAYTYLATQLFDKMPHRRVQDFKNAKGHEIFQLVNLVKESPYILSTSQAHGLALKAGMLAHLPTVTTLLIIYSSTKHFSSSLALFAEIISKDVVTWNAIMTACIKNKYFEFAAKFFAEMVNEGKKFDSSTLVIVVSALSNMRDLRKGMIVHCLSLKMGMFLDSLLGNALIDIYAKCSDLSSSECVFQEVECKDIVSWNSIISGCLYNGHPEKSLWYFKQMASLEKGADGVSLSCAIVASACLDEFSCGEVIQGWGIKLGYEESCHLSVANSLISLYSQSGDVVAAENIFNIMKQKDIITWNSMINGFALNGKFGEAFDALNEMQFIRTLKPDAVTLISIIPLAAEFMLLREGKAIHCFTIRREMGAELSVMNALMDMYFKCKRVTDAEHLFLNMATKDLVSWNTIISGYSQNGLCREAQSLLKKFHSWNSECSLSTLLGILPACDSPNSIQFGRLIHSWEVKLGFLNNIIIVNSLICMYISCGDLVASFKLLEEIAYIADVDSWNTMISGCTQKCHFSEALNAFKLMRLKFNINHDTITLVNVIPACGNLELTCEGKSIHALALKTSAGQDIRVQNALITMYGKLSDVESARVVFELCFHHNLCSWNCMISALAQNNNAKEAIEFFCLLEFEPNEITMATVLSAFRQLGVIRHGKQIHAHLIRCGFYKNAFVSAALVDMYSSCGRLDIARRVFQNSAERSVAAWNSMISAYGFHSNGQKAIEIFHEMIDSGLTPSKVTFINLLTACSHTGLVDQGYWHYTRMLDEFGVHPSTEHHVCVVDMLGRSGRLQQAYNFIKDLPSQPDPGIWGALLSACNYHGDLQLGKRVASILLLLEPENVGYHLALSNIYAASGSWKEAGELRDIVHLKGLKKSAGYSLIDVGSS